MMMIRAGKPVDYVIEALLPYLEAGDIVIDEATPTGRTPSAARHNCAVTAFTSSAVASRAAKRSALNSPAIMPGGLGSLAHRAYLHQDRG